MSDGWTLADLRATAIMDASRTGAVAERNARRLAEAAGLADGGGNLAASSQQAGDKLEASCQPALACLEFTVPVAPRGWQRDTPLGYGRSVKTATEAAYQRDIAKFARQARAAAGGFPLLHGGVRLSVIAYLVPFKSWGKARRADCLAGRILPTVKPDFDNIAKSVGDALTGVLWVDDKQVVAGSCLKVWAEVPSLYVRVQAL